MSDDRVMRVDPEEWFPNHKNGSHALMPWDAYDRLRASVEILGDSNYELCEKVGRLRAERQAANEQRDQAQRWYREKCAEVDQLKDDLRKEWLIGYEEAHGKGYIPVSVKQIDKAWKRMRRLTGGENTTEYFMGRGIEAALRQDFGIVECPECVDHPGIWSSTSGVKCPRCNGHGWIREERGDE